MAVSIKIKNADLEFAKASSEINKLINSSQRIACFQASADLKQTTPVDSGRARGSWAISKVENEFKDTLRGSVSDGILGPIPTNSIETLYINNGTPYIQELNQGTSLQAPSRFIEKTISKYFQTKGNFVKTF